MERREQPRSPPSGDEHLEPADATTLGDAAVLFHDCRRYMPTRCGNNRSPAWRGSDLQGCRPCNWGRSESGDATRPALTASARSRRWATATLWVGSSPSVAQARPFLERSSTLTVATGILNVWQHEPADVAEQRAEVARAFPGRFLLGIGDRASRGDGRVREPAGQDARLLRRARRGAGAGAEGRARRGRAGAEDARARGASARSGPTRTSSRPSTRASRASSVGPGRARRARARGRRRARRRDARARSPASTPRCTWACRNYTNNLLRFGFTERDVADGGSDRLIDAVVPHGSAEAVADAVRAHLDAGADHVALQPLGHGGAPVADYEALARALL